jgi:hypothetical protein
MPPTGKRRSPKNVSTASMRCLTRDVSSSELTASKTRIISSWSTPIAVPRCHSVKRNCVDGDLLGINPDPGSSQYVTLADESASEMNEVVALRTFEFSRFLLKPSGCNHRIAGHRCTGKSRVWRNSITMHCATRYCTSTRYLEMYRPDRGRDRLYMPTDARPWHFNC